MEAKSRIGFSCALLAAIVLLGVSAWAQAAELLETKDPIRTTLPIYSAGNPLEPVLRLQVDNVLSGEIIYITHMLQASNNTKPGYRGDLGATMFQTVPAIYEEPDVVRATSNSNGIGLAKTLPMAKNILRRTHHEVLSGALYWQADADYPAIYVQLMARAAKKSPKELGMKLDVDHGYLQVYRQ